MTVKKRKCAVAYKFKYINSINAITLLVLLNSSLLANATSNQHPKESVSFIFDKRVNPDSFSLESNDTSIGNESTDTKNFNDTQRDVLALHSHHSFNTRDIQEAILQYVDNTLNKRTYEIISGIKIEANKNKVKHEKSNEQRSSSAMTFDDLLLNRLTEFADTHVINFNVPRAVESGRLFFFKSMHYL